MQFACNILRTVSAAKTWIEHGECENADSMRTPCNNADSGRGI